MLQAIDLAVEFDRLRGPLFEGLSIHVSPGERVALVGPNGCGKSTLLRVLAGQLSPTQGHVRLSAGDAVALLDQELPDTGILFDHLGDDPALRRAMHRLGVPAAMLDREAASLSPGERMRALLARTLADEPDILLLDEPTNHLDAPARAWLAGFLRNAREGVLVVTHDRAFADEVAGLATVVAASFGSTSVDALAPCTLGAVASRYLMTSSFVSRLPGPVGVILRGSSWCSRPATCCSCARGCRRQASIDPPRCWLTRSRNDWPRTRIAPR